MKTKKSSYPPINIGTSFLLVIFIVLCMVIFSAFSLSSASKDYEYSKKNAARTQAYYEACNQAEEIRAQIENSNSTQELIEYSVPIDDNEALHVVLKRQNGEDSDYSIHSWTQQSISEWNSTQTLPVLGSE